MLLLTVTLEEEKRSAQWIIFYILNITPLSSLQSIRTSHLREFCLALGLSIRSWPDWSAFFLVFCFIDSLIKQSWGAYSYTVAFWFFPISRSCYRFRRFVLSTPEGIVLYYWKCFQRASLLSVRVVFRAPHTR